MRDRYEVIMAGIGGQGVLTAGRLLAEVAVDKYEHVTWMSSYRAARRGGASECTVIISQDEIASFVLSKSDVVMVMASSQLETFQKRVRPGGALIYEPSGFSKEVNQSDIRLLPVNAMEIASSIGAVQAGNMIFLGLYVWMTGVVSQNLIDEKLASQFKDKVLKMNKEAFQKGIEIGKNRGLQPESMR